MNTVPDRHIIYFDNSATTYPKPQSVIDTTVECMDDYCGNPGRGSHPLAIRSAEKVFEAREAVGSFFGASAENVIFTFNTTYALNMAIKGVMSRGGHLLISNMEHNSVLRPVAKLAQEKKISYDTFTAFNPHKKLTSDDIIADIISKLRPNTKMIVCLHSSNICSHTLPIGEIGKLCRRFGLIFTLDAAQSAGHIDIKMDRDCIDILCVPSHKGLYGPQGCGIMILREGFRPDTVIEGGNGINSLDIGMGLESPERYEAGTLCTPAIAGLCSGVNFVKDLGVENISRHEIRLHSRAVSQLENIKKVVIYDRNSHGGVLLFNIEGLPADHVGDLLSEQGFCLRTGYHCSSLAHKALGTPDGGAVRAGFGIFNDDREVDMLCEAVEKISKSII